MAAAFLRRKGFEILGRNYHTNFGEVDIVAKTGDDYYFVEVKTRRDRELANDMSITKTKRLKLNKTVRAYCYKRNIGECGIVLAGLILLADKSSKKILFRFCVFY